MISLSLTLPNTLHPIQFYFYLIYIIKIYSITTMSCSLQEMCPKTKKIIPFSKFVESNFLAFERTFLYTFFLFATLLHCNLYFYHS